jgi:Protein of unknown function (DUF2971)
MANSRKKSLTNSFTDFVWEKFVVPEHLWHYTDGAGLLGIAKSKSLWCTEYRHLNDRDEISTFAIRLQNYLQQKLKDIWDSEDANLLAETSNLYRTWNVFICSFCTEADRNEHWHQYARKAGYALAFDPLALRSLARAQDFALGPVIYGEDKALSIATAVIEDQLSVWQSFKSPLAGDAPLKLTNFICRLILNFAPFFKPESFEREKEWRLVKITVQHGDGNMLFRASKAFGLLGYYEFKFKTDSHGKAGSVPRKLIPRLVTGPGNETEGWLLSVNPYSLLERS